jgi:type I restriction enzyme M protein
MHNMLDDLSSLVVLKPFELSKIEAQTTICCGNTLKSPQLLIADEIMKFDLIISNPPWNLRGNQEYEKDKFNRFGWGIPSESCADWGWIQHMFASLNPNGFIVTLFPASICNSARDRKFREQLLNFGSLYSVIQLPNKLFLNTTVASTLLVIGKKRWE